jgi:RNA recognition motif-containing protein
LDQDKDKKLCDNIFDNPFLYATLVKYCYYLLNERPNIMISIYVGNLSYSVTKEQLQKLFEQYGAVTAVKIVTDKFTGKSKGFAFVEMSSREEGMQAIDSLNGQEFSGRNVKVNESRPQPQEQRRPQRRF